MPVALSSTSETFSLRVDWCSGVLPHRMVVLLPERLSQYSTRKRLSFSTAGSYRGLPLSSVGTETAELAAPGTPVAGGSRAQPQPKVRARAVQTAPQPIRKTTRFIKTLLCKNREENFSVHSEYETAAFFIAELAEKCG